jgi:hypothetical protein
VARDRGKREILQQLGFDSVEAAQAAIDKAVRAQQAAQAQATP